MILMPHNVIYMKSLTTNERIVLVSLLSLRNLPRGNFFSNQRVAQLVGLSLPTIKRVYAELTRRSFITRTRRENGNSRLTQINEREILLSLKSDMGEIHFWNMLNSKKDQILSLWPELDHNYFKDQMTSSALISAMPINSLENLV